MSDDSKIEAPSNSIDDNIGIVTYIMLSRIYDALCIIGDGVGKGEEILQMIEAHKFGRLLGPDPALDGTMEPIEENLSEA